MAVALVPLMVACTMPIDTSSPELATLAVDVSPSHGGPQGRPLDRLACVAFGAGCEVASDVPIGRGLPGSISGTLALAVQLREVELSPSRCGSVAELLSWELKVLSFNDVDLLGSNLLALGG